MTGNDSRSREEQQSKIDFALLEKEVSNLRSNSDKQSEEIEILRKELSEMKMVQGNLIAKGMGVVGSIIAIGAAVTWILSVIKNATGTLIPGH